MTAGHNALRGSGPGQKPAFEMHWHEWVVLIAGSTGLLFAFPTFLSRQLWRVRPWSAAALTSGEPRSMACAMDLGVAIRASASAVNRPRRSRSPCLLMLPSIASRQIDKAGSAGAFLSANADFESQRKSAPDLKDRQAWTEYACQVVWFCGTAYIASKTRCGLK
jgi:hypothetical protein